MDQNRLDIRPYYAPHRTDDESKKYWQRLDALFDSTMKNAESSYRTNLWINRIVVAIGIILIAYSLIYSAIKGVDLSSVSLAGLGVVTFISTFFTSSQKLISQNVGKLVDIQMLYRSYCRIEEAAGDWDTDNQTKTIEQLVQLNDDFAKNATAISDKIVDVIKVE